jgi:hypothetical protein
MSNWVDPTRQVVTLLLIATACWKALDGTIDAKDFLSLVTIVVLFWFKDQTDKKVQEQATASAVQAAAVVAAAVAPSNGNGSSEKH